MPDAVRVLQEPFSLAKWINKHRGEVNHVYIINNIGVEQIQKYINSERLYKYCKYTQKGLHMQKEKIFKYLQ